MATYQITSHSNATDLPSKSGADTYIVNGGTLVFDCDTRIGPNQGQPIGNITISATLGGTIKIDGKKVRLVPFSGGSGSVPQPGSQITQGGASVELLCVMTDRTGGIVHTGAMPSTGWLKVRGTGITDGPLTGIGATATGADETGWMVVAGTDSRTITVPRLGKLVVDGAWFEVGVTKEGFAPVVFSLPNDQAQGIVITQQPAVVSNTGGTGGAGTPEGDVAAAVQAILLDDFAALDARISNQMHDAYDTNRQWYVLTKWGQHLVGVTTHNPYDMELPEDISIAEMSGIIPDLNFNAWDFSNDVFKASLTPRLNFMARFQVAELAAIRESTDATVRDILERIDASKYINTQDQLTIDSINWFVGRGLLTGERATEVLA